MYILWHADIPELILSLSKSLKVPYLIKGGGCFDSDGVEIDCIGR